MYCLKNNTRIFIVKLKPNQPQKARIAQHYLLSWNQSLFWSVQNIRFGTFTLSTTGKKIVRDSFGATSCFEITTCFGADISHYSVFTGEREVLIPPYEVFTVTNIQTKSPENNLWCEVIYTLVATVVWKNWTANWCQNKSEKQLFWCFTINRTAATGNIMLFNYVLYSTDHPTTNVQREVIWNKYIFLSSQV